MEGAKGFQWLKVIFFLPVVMRADLMADGDQLGCADLIRAATPDT